MASLEKKPRSFLLRQIVLHGNLQDDSIKELCTNEYFSFQTVEAPNYTKHRCRVSCECAILHEYFEYINENGDVNEHEFDQVCSWVDNGKCPHVSFTSSDERMTNMAGVTALHAAVASNRVDLYPRLPRKMLLDATKWHAVEVIDIAVQLQRYSFFDYAQKNVDMGILQNWSFFLTNNKYYYEIINSEMSRRRYSITHTNALRYCFNKHDIRMLQSILKWPICRDDLLKELPYVVNEGNDEWTRVILEYIFNQGELSKELNDDKCIQAKQNVLLIAALNDDPKMLELLERYILRSDADAARTANLQPYIDMAYHVSISLAHSRCADILKNYVNISDLNFPQINPFLLVRNVWKNNRSHENCINAMKSMAKSGFDINQKNRAGNTILLILIGNVRKTMPKIIEIETILKLGGDINMTNNKLQTALLLMLEGLRKRPTSVDKDIIKLLLYYNPDTHSKLQGHTYFELALKRDEAFLKYWDSEEVSSLDLIVMWLWECGFKPSLAFLERCANTDTLPDEIRRDLVEMTSQCRSLKMRCRDSLRRRFPGKCLHDYIKGVPCPTRIKDYILIQDLLRLLGDEETKRESLTFTETRLDSSVLPLRIDCMVTLFNKSTKPETPVTLDQERPK